VIWKLLLVPEDSKIDVERWLSVTVRESKGRDGGREKHFLIATVCMMHMGVAGDGTTRQPESLTRSAKFLPLSGIFPTQVLNVLNY